MPEVFHMTRSDYSILSNLDKRLLLWLLFVVALAFIWREVYWILAPSAVVWTGIAMIAVLPGIYFVTNSSSGGGRFRTGLIFFTITLSMLMSAEMQPPAWYEIPIHDAFPARLDGTVTKVNSMRGSSASLTVHGIVDARDLPPIHRSKIMLRLFRVKSPPQVPVEGSRIVASVMIRRPTYSALPGELGERMLADAMRVDWFAECATDAVWVYHKPGMWDRFRHGARRVMAEGVRGHMDSAAAGVAIAVMTGDKRSVDREVMSAFRSAGTAHIMCVSGAHVGIVAGVILLLTAWIRHPWIRVGVLLTAVWVFVFISGAELPSVRAATMATILVVGRNLQRGAGSLYSLWISLVVIVILDPASVQTAGFHLSAAATAGIIILSPLLNELLMRSALRQWPLWIRNSVAVSVSASLSVSIPLAVFMETFPPLSPIANLFVVPLMSAAMIFAMLTAIFAPILPWCAQAYGALTAILINSSETLSVLLTTSGPTGLNAILTAGIIGIGVVWIVCGSHRLARTAIMCLVLTPWVIPIKHTVPHLTFVRRPYVDCVLISRDRATWSDVVIKDRRGVWRPTSDAGVVKFLQSKARDSRTYTSGPVSESIKYQAMQPIPSSR